MGPRFAASAEKFGPMKSLAQSDRRRVPHKNNIRLRGQFRAERDGFFVPPTSLFWFREIADCRLSWRRPDLHLADYDILI